MMLIRTLVLLSSLCTLTACLEQDEARAQFENYHTRLANVLDTEPLALESSPYIALPRKRDLVVPLEDVRMGVLDAYELRECGLFQLIAERNSILGKVQDAFHRLSYETQLLATITSCLAGIESESLRNQLLDVQQQKQAQYPKVYLNTVTGSDAWRQQLTPISATMIAPDAPFPHSEALLAINSFSGITNNNGDITALQEPIEKQRYLGTLFYSLDESRRWLEATTKQLYRDDASVICGQNRNPTRLNYLRNVFDKFFVGEIQPYLAKLNALYLDAQPALEQLNQSTIGQNAFDAYRKAYFAGDHYRAFRHAVKDHVQYWQQLFKRCDIQIGS